MAQNITLMGASYPSVPAVRLPKTGGGTATFTDITDTSATASEVTSGSTFYLANGTKTTGTLVVQTYYTGTSVPSSSLGIDGDIYLKVV